MGKLLRQKADVAVADLPPPGLARALRERDVARLELAELHRRSSAGDLLAYERLFGLLAPQIARYAGSHGRRLHLEPRLLDEVIDESLNKVHLRLHAVREPEKLAGWVHRIVRNELARARDQQRRESVYADPSEALHQFDRDTFYASIIDPEHVLEFHELLDEIVRLPAGQRSVVFLRELVELDVIETAALLKVCPGTVKSQRHDALANLRTRLAELGYDQG
jgi:RNA polymerase sigma-70 factor (ECF subfamily)